mmetsp:Transcript_49960/g.124226  ORF Transcript_49960/g.124226 Transcript_49960/m.124226 type:complete len:283 (+) Transcript_49960:1283-2131(+)
MCVRASHEVRIHVSPLDEIEHKTQMVFRLEGVAQRHDERVLHARKHLLLSEDGMRLVLRDEDALIDHFDSVEFARIFLFGEQDHAEAARTQETIEVKLVDRDDLAFLVLQRRKLLVQVAVYKSGEDVQLHREHARILDLVEYVGLDDVWLEGRLNRRAEATLHSKLLRRAHPNVLVEDLASDEASILRRLDLLEVLHLEPEEQVLHRHFGHAKLLEVIQVDWVLQDHLDVWALAPKRTALSLRHGARAPTPRLAAGCVPPSSPFPPPLPLHLRLPRPFGTLG